MESISSNINALRQRIAAVCQQEQRAADSVCLIAVGKTFDAAKIQSALATGVKNIGENYVQESITKISQLSDFPAIWHFIGKLQSNKARVVSQHFDWVHTVHSPALARRLSAAREGLPPLNICLQINIDDEDSKNGLLPAEAGDAAREVAALPHLCLRGLMALPRPNQQNPRAPFRTLAQLRDSIAAAHNLALDTLSMGMSDDFEAAIAEGATHIRIGSAIFGAR